MVPRTDTYSPNSSQDGVCAIEEILVFVYCLSMFGFSFCLSVHLYVSPCVCVCVCVCVCPSACLPSLHHP